MDGGGDQIVTVAILGIALALGLGLFFLLLRLGQWVWSWLLGGRSQARREPEPKQAAASETAYASVVTGADLLAIKSNLDAVSRQIEDLERKIRLNFDHRSNILNLRRK